MVVTAIISPHLTKEPKNEKSLPVVNTISVNPADPMRVNTAALMIRLLSPATCCAITNMGAKMNASKNRVNS